jgi:mannose-6-phosphate isomerase-like protein (cupin superfamily)
MRPAMEMIHSDRVIRVAPGTTPDYDHKNPLVDLMTLIERTRLAAERNWYVRDSLQYLFPIEHLELYGPSGGEADVLEPAKQDNKTDFQKQNVHRFITSATQLTRGWVTTGDAWTGPFLRLSYDGSPETPLGKAATKLGGAIKLDLTVNGRHADAPLTVPYNSESHRYEIELWGYTGRDLYSQLGGRSRDALQRGELVARNDLVYGDPIDFSRERLNERDVADVLPACAMHPIRPLTVECAWADEPLQNWDGKPGAGHRYAFSMVLRGWDNYLAVGTSSNPHGGGSQLEYRNLLSNYGRFQELHELGRDLEPWNFNAFGVKKAEPSREEFLSVDYMDLHILKPDCAIGLHRHRDNQEIFLMLQGRALMVVGDWCKMPDRERCLEVRILRAGHFALLKGGNLHALVNATDEEISLFMFGGYD